MNTINQIVIQNEDYSLREKKYARTKVGLMNAFMERLKYNRFDDISIREVCQEVEVAEGTFFNYFPEKIDVVGYYLHLATLKIIWKAKKEAPAGKYLSLIDSVLSQMSLELNNNNVIYQIFSVLLVRSERPKKIDISALEKKMAFPNCEGIEETPSVILDEWLKECVALALKNGELPPKTKADDVVVSLMTIITGTLLAIKFGKSNSREYHYMRQLKALWRGLGVGGRANE
ncbi:MAG TPA: TetR/AcrR family transcriptional regulator [Candidatus Omnitrophota bacterium]|nr:TetR/AcrR family transcriptional regulator [Candidatus Omnitrophota bacterium]HPD84718.1 TetR/AcrR family transcriptional regulator [Candidatus Omnitrophota bacterium]HRZ03576.1 TetR/AcrR family transcriptional regulator [Candidatus Omnitrophota bacterium]